MPKPIIGFCDATKGGAIPKTSHWGILRISVISQKKPIIGFEKNHPKINAHFVLISTYTLRLSIRSLYGKDIP